MAETITGGAFLGQDGTWHDANGMPLAPDAQRRAQDAHDQAQAARDQVESDRATREMVNDPVIRQALRAVAVSQTPKPAEAPRK